MTVTILVNNTRQITSEEAALVIGGEGGSDSFGKNRENDTKAKLFEMCKNMSYLLGDHDFSKKR